MDKRWEWAVSLLTSPSDFSVLYERKDPFERYLAVVSTYQRNIVQLACFQGWALRELAELTGESLANVRHHYYRGLAKMPATAVGRAPWNVK